MFDCIKSLLGKDKEQEDNEPEQEARTSPVAEETKQTKSLFISAGHSNTDPGAVGNGYTEADIVLEFRDMLASELSALGVGYGRDGEQGTNLPLGEAIEQAKHFDLALEFHCNAFHLPSATGVETLSDGKYKEFTDKLNTLMSSTLGIPNRGSKGESSGQHSRLGFISKADGIIVELFFISNPNDVSKYQIKKQELAKKMAQMLRDEVYGV